MSDQINTQAKSDKLAYARPQLTAFGSVRNLTGGSMGSTNGDTISMDMLP